MFVVVVVYVGIMVMVDGVDFVDEDDGWCVFFCLVE